MGALAHIPREQGNGPALVEAVPVAHAPATPKIGVKVGLQEEPCVTGRAVDWRSGLCEQPRQPT